MTCDPGFLLHRGEVCIADLQVVSQQLRFALRSHSTESYCRNFMEKKGGTSQLLGKCSSGAMQI